MELGYVLELMVLGAIAIELFALYYHNRTDNRIDDHILETDRRLEKSDTMMKIMDDHIYRINDHIIRLDEHMNKVESHISVLDEHLIRHHEGLTRLDRQISMLDRIAD